MRNQLTSNLKPIARAGLVAKGVVYTLLGVLTFMAAFHINGKSTRDSSKGGVFDFVRDQTGGQIMLALIAVGLACYCIWRFMQAFLDTEHKGSDRKGLASRARYFFSGAIYGYVAFTAARLLYSGNSGSGDNFQKTAGELLSKPLGQWLVGIVSAILACIGIYQIYYGLSEKYRKHVDQAVHGNYMQKMLLAGKVGYVSRGIVWLLISWLLFKAAIHANSSEAGDTSKVFSFIEESSYGTYLLAAMALGLICYGAFNLLRARFERLD